MAMLVITRWYYMCCDASHPQPVVDPAAMWPMLKISGAPEKNVSPQMSHKWLSDWGNPYFSYEKKLSIPRSIGRSYWGTWWSSNRFRTRKFASYMRWTLLTMRHLQSLRPEICVLLDPSKSVKQILNWFSKLLKSEWFQVMESQLHECCSWGSGL